MSKINIIIPTLENKFFDLRNSLPGDCFTWSWERPLSQVKYLAIHHTATEDNQTPQDIAQFHINQNGWGGIGYHFLIDKEGQVFYVGDLSTARANVANMNEQVIGICLIGNFIQGRVPTANQLDSLSKLCEFFITDYPGLSVVGHKELPNQKTICPGDTWIEWKEKIVITQTEIMDNTLKSQVDNLQTSLATLEQQRISLLEKLQEREREKKEDNTLTIVGALINLYKLVFLPRKVETFG